MKSYIHLLPLLIVAIAGCSTTQPPTSPSNEVHSTTVKSEKQPASNIQARQKSIKHSVVRIAESLIGTPYKYGGADPSGFDCSGLVYYSFLQSGLQVSRTTRQQAKDSSPVSQNELQPGDLLFFQTFGNDISHVGIYSGNGQFIHAPKSGKYVSYQNIDDDYWRDRLVKTGRLK